MQIVAVTGSIGCGKTTLAGLIRQLGFAVYDVDKWCRHLYFEADFLKHIQDIFPETFQNGIFSKRALRDLVFSDRQRLSELEDLTHPFLKRKFFKTIHHLARKADFMFVDVALLFELGLEKYCTYIILADTDYETQKRRVMQRDNITAEAFEKIVRVQMDNAKKKALSDVIIDTNRPLGLLKADLIQIIGELTNA